MRWLCALNDCFATSKIIFFQPDAEKPKTDLCLLKGFKSWREIVEKKQAKDSRSNGKQNSFVDFVEDDVFGGFWSFPTFPRSPSLFLFTYSMFFYYLKCFNFSTALIHLVLYGRGSSGKIRFRFNSIRTLIYIFTSSAKIQSREVSVRFCFDEKVRHQDCSVPGASPGIKIALLLEFDLFLVLVEMNNWGRHNHSMKWRN